MTGPRTEKKLTTEASISLSQNPSIESLFMMRWTSYSSFNIDNAPPHQDATPLLPHTFLYPDGNRAVADVEFPLSIFIDPDFRRMFAKPVDKRLAYMCFADVHRLEPFVAITQ